jgi:hypothetical protein
MVTPPDPVIIPTDPEERRQMIAGASDERLKELCNAVQARMHSLVFKEPRPVSGDYVTFDECLREIKAEMRKRGLNP